MAKTRIRSRHYKITTISCLISLRNLRIISKRKNNTSKNYNFSKIDTYSKTTKNLSHTRTTPKTQRKTTASPTLVITSELSISPNKTSSTDNSTLKSTISVFSTLSSQDTILSLLTTFCLQKKKYWCKCSTNSVMSINFSAICLLRYNNSRYSHSKTLLRNGSKCKNKSLLKNFKNSNFSNPWNSSNLKENFSHKNSKTKRKKSKSTNSWKRKSNTWSRNTSKTKPTKTTTHKPNNPLHNKLTKIPSKPIIKIKNLPLFDLPFFSIYHHSKHYQIYLCKSNLSGNFT